MATWDQKVVATRACALRARMVDPRLKMHYAPGLVSKLVYQNEVPMGATNWHRNQGSEAFSFLTGGLCYGCNARARGGPYLQQM